jgi:hypothetical protein
MTLLVGPTFNVPAQTPVPQFLNYQGSLSNENGDPVPTGDYTLSFRIYDADGKAGGGKLLWGPQIFDGESGRVGHGPKIPVVRGFFNVILGPKDEPGRDIEEAMIGSADTYLEITIGVDNSVLPRQRMASAPYAFRASIAGAVDNDVVTSASILDESITGDDIKDGSITGLDLKDATVTGVDIMQRAISVNHLNFKIGESTQNNPGGTAQGANTTSPLVACPQGQFMSGVKTIDGDGGKFCISCITGVQIFCRPIR